MKHRGAISVLVVNPDFYRSSGVTVAIKRLFTAMEHRPVEYTFVSCLTGRDVSGKREDLDWMSQDEITRLDLMTRNPVSLLLELRKLYKMLKSGDYDILHIHHRRLALLCGWLARRAGVKVVYTGHLVYGRNRLFALAPLDAAIAITQVVAEEVQEDHPEVDVQVVSNIALTPVIEAKGRGPVLCIARLDPVKNHETLLRAWATVSNHRGKELHLLGEGALRYQLEALVNELAISESVRFFGFVDDVEQRIASCSFLVLSSLVEGQGIVTLEGAMHSKPSLVSNVPGSRDAIPPQRTLPNLYEPKDYKVLAGMLETWLSAGDALHHEGRIFLDYTRSHASAEIVAGAHEQIYRKALGI